MQSSGLWPRHGGDDNTATCEIYDKSLEHLRSIWAADDRANNATVAASSSLASSTSLEQDLEAALARADAAEVERDRLAEQVHRMELMRNAQEGLIFALREKVTDLMAQTESVQQEEEAKARRQLEQLIVQVHKQYSQQMTDQVTAAEKRFEERAALQVKKRVAELQAKVGGLFQDALEQ